MFSASASTYGLNFQARCISAQMGQSDRHRFFVGTCTMKEENEIHLIEYDEVENDVKCQGVFRHAAAIHSLSSCPSQQDLIFTTYQDPSSANEEATLWRAPHACVKSSGDVDNDDDDASTPANAAPKALAIVDSVYDLKPVLRLSGHVGRVKSVLWSPVSLGTDSSSGLSGSSGDECPQSQIVSLDADKVRVWDMDRGCTRLTAADDASVSEASFSDIQSGCFDPHHAQSFVLTDGFDIVGLDLRTVSPSCTVKRAHQGTIRCVDYNPNRPHYIVTGGDDRVLCFWDLRRPQVPLLSLGGHSAGIWSAAYNPYHDQLLLTAGTDHVVNLWTVVSLSSVPLGDLADAANDKEDDRLIQAYSEHENSVYDVAWSPGEAWTFASLSYDGRIVVNHVPPTEKYKILL